ncbi:hypothetical protein OKW43_002093 [Paraburkholderia sp. WC7.3g]
MSFNRYTDDAQKEKETKAIASALNASTLANRCEARGGTNIRTFFTH